MNVMFSLGIRPDPGSPLESAYHVLFELQQEATAYRTILLTRAILEAPLQTEEGYQSSGELDKALTSYLNVTFPFHQADKRRSFDTQKEALDRLMQTDHFQVELLPDPYQQVLQARRVAKGKAQLMESNERLAKLVRRRL